jgi:hypothetical protein
VVLFDVRQQQGNVVFRQVLEEDARRKHGLVVYLDLACGHYEVAGA